MFDLRLKRAQAALADGRLDEAFELLNDPALRQPRAGQKLLTQLSEAFIRRGLEHLSFKRLAPALEDCNRAEKLAGNLSAVMELRGKICNEIDAARAESQMQAEQLAKAQEQMQKGWFSTGRKILAHAEKNRQACALLKNADVLEAEKESAAKRIEQALKNGQIELAARIYENSALPSGISEQAACLLERIQTQLCHKLNGCWLEGNIMGAESLLHQFSRRIRESDRLTAFQNAFGLCRQAAEAIESGRFDAAGIALRKIQILLPKTKWLEELVRCTQAAAQANQDLQSGPLGLLRTPTADDFKDRPMPGNPAPPDDQPGSVEKKRAEPKMAGPFILQMDGIGAYHVFTADRVTLGPVSATQRSDIELVTAPDVRPQQIERIDGDYFFGEVNKGPAVSSPKRRLLCDGDRIELSPRCRFKFTLPNPASSTACLTPSSARFPRADINGVLLMGREILIGPERNCHIQSGQISEQLILYVHDQEIRCRTLLPVFIEGKAQAPHRPLPMNTRLEIGELRLILTAYHD